MKRRFVRLLSILAVGIISSNCTSIPANPSLQVPPSPSLPKIQASELQCLTDETYQNLVIREKLLQGHIVTLEEIIRATH